MHRWCSSSRCVQRCRLLRRSRRAGIGGRRACCWSSEGSWRLPCCWRLSRRARCLDCEGYCSRGIEAARHSGCITAARLGCCQVCCHHYCSWCCCCCWQWRRGQQIRAGSLVKCKAQRTEVGGRCASRPCKQQPKSMDWRGAQGTIWALDRPSAKKQAASYAQQHTTYPAYAGWERFLVNKGGRPAALPPQGDMRRLPPCCCCHCCCCPAPSPAALLLVNGQPAPAVQSAAPAPPTDAGAGWGPAAALHWLASAVPRPRAALCWGWQ